jgi:hypothetical protein
VCAVALENLKPRSRSLHSRAKVAKAFSRLVVHDDTMEGITFYPAKGRTERSRGNPEGGEIEVQLYRYWEKSKYRRLLVFEDCVNMNLQIDTTILAYNMPGSTSHVEASTDVAAIRRAIRRHTAVWNCAYVPRSSSPLAPKLARADQWVLFRLQLFGGVLEVVARSFRTRRLFGKASEYYYQTLRRAARGAGGTSRQV